MADVDEERAVLEVVELSESEDEDFDYRAVEVRVTRNIILQLFLIPNDDILYTKISSSGCGGWMLRHRAQIIGTVWCSLTVSITGICQPPVVP